MSQTGKPSNIPAYIELLKPSLTFMSTLTGVGGFVLAVPGGWNSLIVLRLLVMTLGTLAIGGGAVAINQYIERTTDSQMKRTEKRPIPSGRVSAGGALLFGAFLTLAGLAYFLIFVNVTSACVAAAISASYLLLYTPLKRHSVFSTLAGGIPGALPPVLGWTVVRDVIGTDALILFAILFFWQIPHFLALAWLYRNDYQRAGMRVLSLIDANGSVTSRHAMISLSLLLPTSLMPVLTGLVSPGYVAAALLPGMVFSFEGLRFAKSTVAAQAENDSAAVNKCARRLFFTSLAYLPVIFLILLLFKS